VVASCSISTWLSFGIVYGDNISDPAEMVPMLIAIAEHGLQLKELSIDTTILDIDL
jgi:hypothetical protein